MSRRAVLRSPSLLLGEVEVVESRSRSRRRLRGTVAKRFLTPFARHVVGNLPEPVARGAIRMILGGLQVAAPCPGNQLLLSCEQVAALARRAGRRHHARAVYRDYVDGIRTVLELALRIYKHGADTVLSHIEIEPAGLFEDLVRRHGGCMVCVPHNTGALLSSLKLSRTVPTILLARNPSSVARTRTALDAYERLGARVLLVRGGNPFELSRACLRALQDGELVVATIDRIHRGPNRVLAPIFGHWASLAPWAARMAARAKVPVVPAYAHVDRQGVQVACGRPLVSPDADLLMRHYLGYMESRIYDDPSSWSFLGDRRWRWVMRDALSGVAESDGGVLRRGRDPSKLPPARRLAPARSKRRHLRALSTG